MTWQPGKAPLLSGHDRGGVGQPMDRPVREAEPFFSQPVRQITMMLIVLALVGAGAWLIYAKILSVFVDNPWLNGTILGVFGIGVLTCFWQVAQLVYSVSWIEAFASDRPDRRDAPRLLAPLASLLRSRGARSQIAYSSSRSILESVSTRIEEARDITRYITNLLIFLGLLGTLYGLTTTVPAVVDTIRALAPKEGETSVQVFEKLMTGLEAQLGGMGTAFSSSLLGLAGSLVVGLLELFAGHGQNRFYRELEEWLSSFTRLGVAGTEGEGQMDTAVFAEAFDQMAERMEAVQAVLERTETARGGADARLEGLLTALAQRIAQDGAAAPALDRIAEGQDRIVALMEADRDDSAPSGPDAESRMRLRSIDVQLLRLLEEVAAGRQESLADLRSDLANLTKAVRMLGRPEPAHGHAPAPARRD